MKILKNKITNNFKKNIDLYLLNYFLIIIYFIVFIILNIKINWGLLFETTDAWTYLCASTEFYKFSEIGYSSVRPFLYPLIILIVYNISGVVGLWILQFFLWIFSINLIFLSIKRLTNNRILSFAGSLIIALNLTYIVLTFHALTEVTSVFLLSLLIYFVSFNALKADTLKFFHGCLLILILLALVKPLFYLPVLFILFIILPVFYFKKYLKSPKSLILLLIIIVPFLFQITLMKVKYNTFSFSQVGSNTFKWYYLAEGVKQIENISLDAARLKTGNLSTSEELSYMLNNKMVFIDLYFHNMKENIKAVPCFTVFPKGFPHSPIVKYMTIANILYYYIHIIFIIPLLISLYSVFKRKDLNYYLVPMILSWFLIYYIFLSIPIALKEGDRLALPSLPLWVFLYVLVLNYWFKKDGLFKQSLSR